MTTPIDKPAIRQSFGRAISKPAFLVRFYETLTTASPEAARKLADTDLKEQYSLLEHSLAMALLYSENNIIAKQAIEKIRKSHNRENLAISPELYAVWLDSLIDALHHIDPEFTPELELQWRAILKISIDHIKSGY